MVAAVVGEVGVGGVLRVARRWGAHDVADVPMCAWEIFGRGGGSEAWMDGAVDGLTVTVTGGFSVNGTGVERVVELWAAALI